MLPARTYPWYLVLERPSCGNFTAGIDLAINYPILNYYFKQNDCNLLVSEPSRMDHTGTSTGYMRKSSQRANKVIRPRAQVIIWSPRHNHEQSDALIKIRN